MKNCEDQISIGLLQAEDRESANEVWLPNFTDLLRIYSHQVLRSSRFFVACALTHLLIVWLFSVPVATSEQLVTFIISISIHVSWVWFFIYTLNRPKDYPHSYEYWSQPHRRFVVARDESQEGRVVGTVAIEHRANDPSVTELFRFRVLPGYRQRGIGTRITNEVERLAKEEFNCRTIMLKTAPEHVSGISFYVKNGYKLMKTFRFPTPYFDPKFVALVYEKDLQ